MQIIVERKTLGEPADSEGGLTHVQQMHDRTRHTMAVQSEIFNLQSALGE